jgi:hypothetical protein
MFPGLVALAATFLASTESAVLAIPEFRGPYGIADLAVAVVHPDLLRRRRLAGVSPILYEPDIAVADLVPIRQPRSAQDIASRLGWSVDVVTARLKRLRRGGAVEHVAGKYLRHPDLLPAGKLHLLEAKVEDWRGGRFQARRYQLWADTASVVMARHPAAITSAVEFTRWRLGFAVQDKWIRKPQMYRRSRSQRFLSSELIVAALGPLEADCCATSPALPLRIQGETGCQLSDPLLATSS